MFAVEVYATVRQLVFNKGKSRREVARLLGLSRDTVCKMCRFSAPPGYVRSKPVVRPKLPLIGVIDAILECDRTAPPKQRHTAKRVFERLRDEHGFAGGYTTVRGYVREARTRPKETFVPLSHPPGHAQVDFGEALGVIGGERVKIHFFCMDLPHSDACFVKAYPAETLEAFLDGHVSAFAFFGGVPHSVLYDNTKLAVARILPDGTRERTLGFTRLISHYVFKDRFGRPGKGKERAERHMLSTATAVLDWFGVIVFTITGALVASRKQMDVVGFALLGTVTGIGGGTLRDILLGELPVFWVSEPAYLVKCVLVSRLVFFTAHIPQSRYSSG